MKGIYRQVIDDFAAVGGTLLNVYSSTSAGFATLDSIYDAPSPAWQAMVEAQAATPVVIAAPAPTPAPPPSASASRDAR